MSKSAEQWRPIPGYEGLYEISDHGRVRSLHRSGRLRRLSLNSRGYLSVDLWRGGRQKTCRVNRLVLEAFDGPAPAGYEACHNNGNRADNRRVNLRWDTRLENQRDIVRHGNHVNASKNSCPQSHPYDAENTYIRPDGGRGCRECRRQSTRAHRERSRSKS